ncbi:MAG: N-acetylneuraminate lyase, partial [Tissierellia bacterium]|nr:N-acetylneuraminate lyase [Tissierellia bacterium]
VKGVKNSSMPVMDIERLKAVGGDDIIVFNGADEQYVAGRLMGADGGIGGTYGAMPELYLKAEEFVSTGKINEARNIQRDINDIIIALCSLNGSMYSAIKEILKLNGVNIGNVRGPLEPVSGEDLNKIEDIKKLIDNTIIKYRG